jgi:hypothetical protein
MWQARFLLGPLVRSITQAKASVLVKTKYVCRGLDEDSYNGQDQISTLPSFHKHPAYSAVTHAGMQMQSIRGCHPFGECCLLWQLLQELHLLHSTTVWQHQLRLHVIQFCSTTTHRAYWSQHPLCPWECLAWSSPSSSRSYYHLACSWTWWPKACRTNSSIIFGPVFSSVSLPQRLHVGG